MKSVVFVFVAFLGFFASVYGQVNDIATLIPVAVFEEDSREDSSYRATGKITCYFQYIEEARMHEDVFAGTGNFVFADQLDNTAFDIVASSAHVFEHPDVQFIAPYRCTLTNYYRNNAILVSEIDLTTLLKGPYERTQADRDDWAVFRINGEPYGFEGVRLSSLFGAYRYMSLNEEALELYFQLGATPALVAYNRQQDIISISRQGELYVPQPGDLLYGIDGVWGSSLDVSRTGSGGAVLLELEDQTILVGFFKGSRHNLATYSEFPGDGSLHSRRDSTNVIVRPNSDFNEAIRILSDSADATTED